MSRGKWAVVLAACIVLAAVAAAYAAGQAKVSAPEVIRAQRFELVDAEGKVYAALRFGRRAEAEGAEVAYPVKRPVLEMYGENGRARVRVFVGPRGPGLDLLHDGWKPAIALRVIGRRERGGEAELVLMSEEDCTRGGMRVSSEEGARLELSDERGRTIWSRP